MSRQPRRNHPPGFKAKRAHLGGTAGRKAMIDREHDLSINKQEAAPNISRGSVYYLPHPVSASDLGRRLDRLQFPFAGSRMVLGLLVAEGARSAAGA